MVIWSQPAKADLRAIHDYNNNYNILLILKIL